ncbi:MAG: hypothetical protein ACFFD4_29655 [Candidatus Odinarchaeota archaeon]
MSHSKETVIKILQIQSILVLIGGLATGAVGALIEGQRERGIEDYEVFNTEGTSNPANVSFLVEEGHSYWINVDIRNSGSVAEAAVAYYLDGELITVKNLNGAIEYSEDVEKTASDSVMVSITPDHDAELSITLTEMAADEWNITIWMDLPEYLARAYDLAPVLAFSGLVIIIVGLYGLQKTMERLEVLRKAKEEELRGEKGGDYQPRKKFLEVHGKSIIIAVTLVTGVPLTAYGLLAGPYLDSFIFLIFGMIILVICLLMIVKQLYDRYYY